MSVDFQESPIPGTLQGVWAALVRLVRSLNESEVVIKREALDAAGTKTVTHGRRGRGAPKFVSVQVVGNAASTAIVTVGICNERVVTLHTTAACVVDIKASF